MKDGKDRPKNKDGNSKGLLDLWWSSFGQILSKPGKSECYACWKGESKGVGRRNCCCNGKPIGIVF